MAKKDLKALSAMTDINIFEDEIFGFHAQQTIEKSVKAWIVYLGIEFPRTHDITFLLLILEEQGINIEQYKDFIEYNIFAVQFCYEAFDSIIESLNRKATIKKISEFVAQIDNIIKI